MKKNKLSARTLAGFTLLELSVVVLIIGLLAAGVSVGKSMIEAAQLNSVINSMKEYKNATYSFESTYQYLPGDFPGASSVWPLCSLSTVCNGDGNGWVGSTADEPFLFWLHLSYSDMIALRMSPYNGAVTQKLGDNYPLSKIPGAGFIASTFFIKSPMNVAIYLGTIDSTTFNVTGKLTPAQVYSVDQKIDDGNLDSSGNYVGAWTGSIRISGSFDPSSSLAGFDTCFTGNTSGFMGALGASSQDITIESLESLYGKQVYYNMNYSQHTCVMYSAL